MAIGTYAQLVTAVGNWLHRSDLSSNIPDFIALAESRIWREIRTADMETDFSGTISGGFAPLPENYIELKWAYGDGSPVQPLLRKSARWIYENYPVRGQGGPVLYIARQGQNFVFGPAGNGSYRGVCYTRLGSISTVLHGVFTNNPDLYLFGALAEAEPFLQQDDRVALWKAKYNEIRGQVNELRDREDHSGSDIRVTAQ